MERNHIVLKGILMTALVASILTSCFNGIGDKGFDNLNRQDFSLQQAIGEYYNLPSQNESDSPNYKDFGLKKGDSIIMRINTDSTFVFNHFYYGNLIKIDGYKGRVSKQRLEKDKIQIPFPDNVLNGLQGFFHNDVNDIYFYVLLDVKNNTEYEYMLMYKKKKN